MSSYTIAGDDKFDDVPVIAKPRTWGELISTFTTSHVSHPIKENQRAHSVTHTLLIDPRQIPISLGLFQDMSKIEGAKSRNQMSIKHPDCE